MDDIVLVSGGFDPIHSGHIKLIKEASEHGRVVILLNSDYTSKKRKFMSFLKKNGIATQIHYKPLSLHKVYKKNTLLNDCGNAKKFYKSQITLPLHTKMNMKDIDRITGLISEFFKS